MPTLSQVWPQHALFWGKAGKPQEVKHPPYHSALLHMLDVGLVAHALLEAGWRRLFFDEPDRQQGLWLALLVACHDVGKISPGFQNKRSDLEIVQEQKRLGFPFSQNDDDDHGRVTLATLPKLLEEQTQSRLSIAHANQLARAVGGHHGVFHVDFNQARAGQGQWTDARRRLVETLRQAFGLDWSSFPFCAPPRPEFLIKLAGLTCLADWIGSQEDRFPYCGDADLDLDDYVTDRQQRAHAALAKLHLTDAPLTAGESALEQLFTYLPGFTPNACQTVAWEVARRFDEPCLVVIEYPMGGGKTEAALGITDCWLHKRRLRGWYYALPTQATGNAMFERLLEFIRHHPARKGDVELHLLHGNADINESYEKLRQVSATAVYDADEHGGVRASGWFTARKRGLLASLGVGTIDQALLGVLQTRHMFVRLFGLAGKVVILDEVHAYDTYTSETLFRLVNWLGALGSSVIVLSATLPTDKRRALLKAYAPTLDESALPAAPYPGVTAVGRSNKVCSESIPIAETDRRAVQLELLEVASDARWEQLAATLTAKLIDGGCAACLVNTVSDAQELFVYLKQRLGCAMEAEWILFHARFPLEQRLAIEARIKALFGKDGRRPHRAVVVATQVMEQSLDVDFDLMFTVLAPVDLVLQRAGRLHRHQRRRPTGLDTATLYCLLPPHLESRPDFGESEFIYEPLLLHNTALALKRHVASRPNQPLRLPDDIPVLMSQVYGPDFVPAPPATEAKRQAWAQAIHAENQLIGFTVHAVALPQLDPTQPDSRLLTKLAERLDEETAPAAMTRLARPSITVALLHESNGRMYLDADGRRPVDLSAKPDTATTRDILKRSVVLSHPEWVNYFKGRPSVPAWEASPQLKFVKPAILHGNSLQHGQYRLALDPELGVLLQRL